MFYRTAEEKEDWIQARITLMLESHSLCLSCPHAVLCACGLPALLENGISKDFLPTLIQGVWELNSPIKPLIIAHLAHYSRVKLIKTFCRVEERVGAVCGFYTV